MDVDGESTQPRDSNIEPDVAERVNLIVRLPRYKLPRINLSLRPRDGHAQRQR